MFQRNIAVLAARKREVHVTSPVGEWYGYVTGLDEFTLQLCRTSDMKYVLISREGSLTVEESGKSLYELKREGTWTEDELVTLEGKISNFADIARHHVPPRKGLNSDGSGEQQWEEVQ